jgi:hypothetical protein
MKLPRLDNEYLDRAILAVENFMSLYLVIGGLQTAFSGSIAATTALGHILGSQISLMLFGLVLFTSGCMLLYASIAKKEKLQAKILMVCFCVLTFTFFAELTLHTGGVDSGAFALISGLFYLRRKRLEPLPARIKRVKTP